MEQSINYRGYSIEVHRDESPTNPFKDYDGLIPTISEYEDYSDGDIDQYLINYLTDGQIIKHQKKLIKLIYIGDGCFVGMNRKEKANAIREQIEYFLSDYQYPSKQLRNKAWFCDLFNIPYLHTIVRGYSQGSATELFICPTPKFYEVTGAPEQTPKNLQSTADLYRFWAFGDVYGYICKDKNGEKLDFGSCWGYYGDVHEDSGLLEGAKNYIDAEIAHKRKERINKLKQLIKANVPLFKRVEVLQTI